MQYIKSKLVSSEILCDEYQLTTPGWPSANLHSNDQYFFKSEVQNNVSTGVISFCVSLTGTGHDRARNGNGLTMTIKIFPSLSYLCTLEPYIDFVFI